ncbi:unnamed protein product [Clavelina lepadiformis]|uniref:Uncharacterized protein n=1 Tax=Clavelina lepadiformis TaxID=159417 RepID=A0ABP0G435_CLALP
MQSSSSDDISLVLNDSTDLDESFEAQNAEAESLFTKSCKEIQGKMMGITPVLSGEFQKLD